MKAVGKGTVESRGKGRWRLRVSVTFDNGKQMRVDKNVECRTKTEAKARLDEWRLELLSADDPRPTRKQAEKDQTLVEYLEDYVAYCHDIKHLSPNTVRGYRDIVRNRWAPRIGNTPLRELTPAMLDEHVSWLRTKGSVKTGGPLSAKTVNEATSFLSTALERAERLEKVDRNPARFLGSVPDSNREEVKALTEEEVIRMKEVVLGHPDYRFATMVTLALDTGMRRGELGGLEWRDVDFEKGRLHVRQAMAEGSASDTYNGRTLEGKRPKSRRSARWITLPPSTLAMLKAHAETQYRRMRYNGVEQTADTPVLGDALGQPYRPSKLTSDFIAFAKQHSFEVTLHGLRHTHASILLKHGMPIERVSQRLGHESVDITYRVYSHFIPEDDGGAAETWERATEPRHKEYVAPSAA